MIDSKPEGFVRGTKPGERASNGDDVVVRRGREHGEEYGEDECADVDRQRGDPFLDANQSLDVLSIGVFECGVNASVNVGGAGVVDSDATSGELG